MSAASMRVKARASQAHCSKKKSKLSKVLFENPTVNNNSKVREAVKLLATLTDEERVGVFKEFCPFCGGDPKKSRCECDLYRS
jgi:hypothetical protein